LILNPAKSAKIIIYGIYMWYVIKSLRVLLVLVSACTNISSHGIDTDYNLAKQFKPHITSKEDVVNIIGSPAFKSELLPETWYYSKTKHKSIAFFKPKIIEQEILAIEFHNDKVVQTKQYTLQDAREVDFSKESIEPGENNNELQQLLRNTARFNKNKRRSN
jgi:outer membrane protein assembly factor BamE (lipoprotein component of BamABCDE complex)